ncbi:hypothetical protein LFL97_20060 [Burkholderia sp. JSH-S8]|nr:hypothetical protein LFL97_20060 [Burkholderia sp. JSH-S8]
MFWLEFRCWLDRRRVSVFGKTYTLAPMRHGRDVAVNTRSFSRGKDLERFEALRNSLLTRAEEDNDE